ncbi:hypothetical protein B0H14DRAFT_2712356 [Mycena olivaceomarginata]|nr:hypothetical protein B0H14DRAFT_2712356 [Mycena olivaceomarginata]
MLMTRALAQTPVERGICCRQPSNSTGRPPSSTSTSHCRPQNIQPLTPMPSAILMESATEPPLSPHSLIRPAEGKIVLMRDVLVGIYTSLRKSATQADYELLSLARQHEAAAAYSRRWKRMPTPELEDVERLKGLKRVDFLRSTVSFAGVSKSQLGHNYLNLLLTPISRKKIRFNFETRNI